MKIRWWFILSTLVLIPAGITVSFTQTKTPADTDKHGAALRQVLRIAIDSAFLVQQKNVDSLSDMIEKSLQTQTWSLTVLADSLVKSAGEFFDSSRIDSAYQLHKDFSGRLKKHAHAQQQAFRKQLLNYKNAIIGLQHIHEACLECITQDDMMNELSSFYEHADSSSDAFFASLADHVDDASGSLSDSTETFCDSLITFVETLVDNRETELDSIEQHSNKLMISIDANSISYYHGRDGGVSQGIVSPLISFRHSSGVKLSLGMSWLARQENHWDGTSLGLSYEFMLSSILGGSIGYTHFWFDSSSTQLRSVFNQSVDAELDLSTSIADFSLAGEINFDDQSEYAFDFSATRYWQFGRTLTLAPTVSISWGEQNLTLINRQLQKIQRVNPKTKKIVTKNNAASTANKSNFFSILDYQITIPLNIRLHRITLTPSVTAVFPLAVFDGSRDLPFLNAELTATIDWIW